MNCLKGICRNALRSYRKIQACRQTGNLLKESEGVDRMVWEAIHDTLHDKYDDNARQWMEKIESLRKKLNASTESIEVIDYGAGNPKATLTEAEMYQGKPLSKTLSEISVGGSKPTFWCQLLFNLLRKIKPSTCVELGTCVGISASYQAAALKMNGHGQILSLEGSPSLASLSQKNLSGLGFDNATVLAGRFQDILSGVLEQHKPVDYAFIDGHHSEAGTLAYFKQIIPYLSDRAVLVFDDISWSDGMRRAWKAIESDERVSHSASLIQIGICVIEKGVANSQKHVSLRLL